MKILRDDELTSVSGGDQVLLEGYPLNGAAGQGGVHAQKGLVTAVNHDGLEIMFGIDPVFQIVTPS